MIKNLLTPVLAYNLNAKSIIVVAKANKPGRSFPLAEALYKLLDIEYKVYILCRTQRGGRPTVKDCKIASLMGNHAVEALLAGNSQKMLAMVKSYLELIKFFDPALGARKFTDQALIKINQILCDI